MKKISKKIIAFCLLLLIIVIFFGSFWISVSAINFGKFCTLQEAYNEGILQYEDLLNIAYLNNGQQLNESINEDYVPQPKPPNSLSGLTKFKIKCTASTSLKDYFNKTIKNYLGTYNGAVVVIIKDKSVMIPAVITEFTIAGILFVFPTETAVIWSK